MSNGAWRSEADLVRPDVLARLADEGRADFILAREPGRRRGAQVDGVFVEDVVHIELRAPHVTAEFTAIRHERAELRVHVHFLVELADRRAAGRRARLLIPVGALVDVPANRAADRQALEHAFADV